MQKENGTQPENDELAMQLRLWPELDVKPAAK